MKIIMNTWLYRRCGLYRRLFDEELSYRRIDRKINRYRRFLQKQMEAAANFFKDAAKAGDFSSALDAAAFYIDAYIKLNN